MSDLRVLEFSIGVAAPLVGRYLAHHGAQVIRVESRRRPDSLRIVGSGWIPLDFDSAVRGDTTPLLNFTNPQKCSLGLEVRTPRGIELLRDLVAVSDVIVTNLSADVLPGWGLGYEEARLIRPDIVYTTVSGFGSGEGPYRDFRAWGANQSAIGGVDFLHGWPDREPVVMPMSYPDYIGGYHGLIATLAALYHRDLTGEGQYVDVAQFETTVACVGPELLAYNVGGEVAERTGNRRAGSAPNGVYPARDPERWVAISVRSETEWQGLCRVMDRPDWSTDPGLASPRLRFDNHDALDAGISEWTLTAWEVAEELQAEGVAAAPVFDNSDLVVDPQLAARRFWRVLPHLRFGRDLITGYPIRLSRAPASFDRAGPALGEDSVALLDAVLGLGPAEISDLIAGGTVYVPGQPQLHLERPYLPWIRHFMDLEWPESSHDPAAERLAELSRLQRDAERTTESG